MTHSTKRAFTRCVLAVFYFMAGCFHLAAPEPFLKIMPLWVPMQGPVVFWTGVAELLGAMALLQPISVPLRKAGAIGLALYALCVFPANINHFAIDLTRVDGGLGLTYHVPRMIAQPLLIALTLWAGGVVGRRGRSLDQAPPEIP